MGLKSLSLPPPALLYYQWRGNLLLFNVFPSGMVQMLCNGNKTHVMLQLLQACR